MNALTAPHKGEKLLEQEYLFPLAEIKSREAQHMVEAVNKANQTQSSLPYSVHLELVKFPIKGVKLKIMWDPARVQYAMESFQAITRQEGFVVRFFNQELLNTIKNKGSAVLTTASSTRKGVVIDCGHGGADKGTCGFYNTQEKKITLDIGLTVAQQLRTQGYDVFDPLC